MAHCSVKFIVDFSIVAIATLGCAALDSDTTRSSNIIPLANDSINRRSMEIGWLYFSLQW